jgi:hypothetical protein
MNKNDMKTVFYRNAGNRLSSERESGFLRGEKAAFFGGRKWLSSGGESGFLRSEKAVHDRNETPCTA